eukprot:1398335-Rhodomonas_salina.1
MQKLEPVLQYGYDHARGEKSKSLEGPAPKLKLLSQKWGETAKSSEMGGYTSDNALRGEDLHVRKSVDELVEIDKMADKADAKEVEAAAAPVEEKKEEEKPAEPAAAAEEE